jgi:predicted dienelactone hydrolase
LNRKSGCVVLAGLAGLILLLVISIRLQIDLPAATGPYPVGRTVYRWTDTSRLESLTEIENDHRGVPVEVWYPAEAGTGERSSYIHDLARIAPAMRTSGELHSLEVAGLPLIRTNSYWQAEVAKDEAAFPVLLLSPGNGTNVEFYSILAEELASQGYVVFGINHPYEVAAVTLEDGTVAGYYSQQWLMEPKEHQAFTQERIDVRVHDALFTLDQLEVVNTAGSGLFAGKLDLRPLFNC